MLVLLNALTGDIKTLPNMNSILKDRLISSLEDLEADDLTVERNNPDRPICVIDEVLLFEHLFLNKAALRRDEKSFWINRGLKPISSVRIPRHLAIAGGFDFYKLRKAIRVHTVFLSNVKLRVLDEDGKVRYGDASEEHQFQSDSY